MNNLPTYRTFWIERLNCCSVITSMHLVKEGKGKGGFAERRKRGGELKRECLKNPLNRILPGFFFSFV